MEQGGSPAPSTLCWSTVEVPCFQQSINILEHILRVLSRTLKKTMVCLANLKNSRIFNDSQTQLRHHSYEVPSKSAGHLRPECASLTTCTNDGKAKRQQGPLPNTLLFPGEAGSDPGLSPDALTLSAKHSALYVPSFWEDVLILCEVFLEHQG